MSSKIYKIKSTDIPGIIKTNTASIYTKDNRYLYFCTDTKDMRVFYSKSIVQRFSCIVTTQTILDSASYLENHRYYYTEDTNRLYYYSNNIIITIIDTDLDTFTALVADKQQEELVKGEDLADNNGLLGDGTVIVRDENKLVKARLKIDNSTNNLMIGTDFGNTIRILPNGIPEDTTEITSGELTVGSDSAKYNGVFSATYFDNDEGNLDNEEASIIENISNYEDYPNNSIVIDTVNVSLNIDSLTDVAESLVPEVAYSINIQTNYNINQEIDTSKYLSTTCNTINVPNTNIYSTTLSATIDLSTSTDEIYFLFDVFNFDESDYAESYNVSIGYTPQDLNDYNTSVFPRISSELSEDKKILKFKIINMFIKEEDN